jgi:hypothetical protein
MLAKGNCALQPPTDRLFLREFYAKLIVNETPLDVTLNAPEMEHAAGAAIKFRNGT